MDLDLSLLHGNVVKEVSVKDKFIIPEDYLENSEIIRLSPVSLDLVISLKENDEFELNDYAIYTIKGEMVILDSISLEEVSYPFLIKQEDFLAENWIKNENTLDIFAFLWENIELEVPLQFTKVDDFSKFHGDGWRLIHEEDLTRENNPFRNLLKDFEEE